MAGLFAKAAQKAKETVKDAKKKATAWAVGSSSETEAVSRAIKELVSLEAQSKAIEAKMNVVKGSVKRYSDEMFVRDYAARGSMPETPMTVQNPDGEKVTYVVQDRGKQYAVKPDQQDAVENALGEAISGMVGVGMLDGDQAELLLSVNSKTTFRSGTLDQLVQICGRDTSRMKQFLDIAGSSFTRYVKC